MISLVRTAPLGVVNALGEGEEEEVEKGVKSANVGLQAWRKNILMGMLRGEGRTKSQLILIRPLKRKE